MALVQRLLDITFSLGEGAFGESGTNTVTLKGLRTSARIIKAGGPSMGNLQMEVYGMTLSLMNQLSTLGLMPTLIRRNTIVLTAGDTNSGMGTVFQGTITNAWADFQAAPDVAFHVEAHTGLIEAVAPVPPISRLWPVPAMIEAVPPPAWRVSPALSPMILSAPAALPIT